MSDDLIIKGGMTLGSGILGSLLTFFGIQSRLTRLEKESVTKDVCQQCQAKSRLQIDNLCEDIKEVKVTQGTIATQVSMILQNQATYMAKLLKE